MEEQTMNESTKTKKALRGSLFALFLCIVLLIGTTFAWFTDTASTGVNKIQAGNLKVGLQYSHDGGTTWNEAKNAEDIFAKNALWEPGHVEYVNLKVSNLGNLALKYKLGINVASETPGINVNDATFKLSDYLKMAVVDGATKYDTRDAALIAAANGGTLADYTKDGRLAPQGKTLGEITDNNTVTVIVYMPETVGNEANYKTGTTAPSIDMGIEVNATQLNSENDSFGPDYDKNATYPVASASELGSALNEGKIVALSKDITTNDTIVVNKNNATLDANGKTVDNTDEIWNEATGNWSLVSVRNKANLTITGNGTFNAKKDDCFAVDVQDGSTVTIKNGTFVGNVHAVYVLEGTAIIEGGTYSVQQKYSDASKADEFILNCYDANRTSGTAKIIVKGGTFINFNPADCQAEGAHTNFVADGYKVTSKKQSNGDIWYTVVPE
jgi:predicted ribosomally synthesized peptide with SipW-like signal peptide